MGTTAEKLKYLNETKAEIKNALETPYNVMRDYPELIKKYIDNQPTKVVTDGICGNAVDVPVKAIETNGNIRQETTEGYNLFDKSTANIGKTLNAQGELQEDSGGGFSTSDYIQIKPNTNYYLYNVLPTYYVRTCSIYDDNKDFIKIVELSGSKVGNLLILTPTNAKYIRITYKTLDVDIVQVTKGTNLLPYEPYHEPIITPINLQGNILSKKGDVKDILKINRNGRVTIRKNIGKVTFVGDDTYAWNMSNSSITGLNAFWILISRYNQLNWKQKIQTKLSNYFTYYQKEWKQVTEPCICENTDLKPDMCIFSGFDSNMSLTKWKEWLSQHPTEVYYELATPQTITLPSISPIELWQGTNIFKLITNLDTDFEVEYVVDKDSVTKEEE